MVWLNDETQELIQNEEDLFRLIDEKLGRDVSRKIKEMFFDFEKSEFEYYEDEIYKLEIRLKVIQNFTNDLIQNLPSKKIDEQEFLGYLRKIGRMAEI